MEMILGVESFDAYLNSLSGNGTSPNTIRGYRSDLMGWWTWAQTTSDLREATNLEELAKLYLNLHRHTWEPRTTRRKVAAIRGWARHNGETYLANYKTVKPARARPHPLDEGVNGVLEMLDTARTVNHKGLIILCGLLGLRVSEARTITPRCFMGRPPNWLRVEGKGGKYRDLPVSGTVEQLIRPLLAERLPDEKLVCMSDRGARVALTRIAGVAHLSRPVASHDLRATMLTAAYDKTKDLRAVQELAGHSSSTTTELYTGVKEEAMRKAMDII